MCATVSALPAGGMTKWAGITRHSESADQSEEERANTITARKIPLQFPLGQGKEGDLAYFGGPSLYDIAAFQQLRCRPKFDHRFGRLGWTVLFFVGQKKEISGN